MTTTVVDASVAVKWYVRDASETLKEEARQLLIDYARGSLRLVVPDFFFVEVANALWKAVRQGRIEMSAALDALTELSERNIPAISSADLIHQGFVVATTYNRSVYDSMYVALAIESKGQFVTADERLVNALRAHFPVRWLGAG